MEKAKRLRRWGGASRQNVRMVEIEGKTMPAQPHELKISRFHLIYNQSQR